MKRIATTIALVVFLAWAGTAHAGHHQHSADHTGHSQGTEHGATCEHAAKDSCPHAAAGEPCPHHGGDQCSHSPEASCTDTEKHPKADA